MKIAICVVAMPLLAQQGVNFYSIEKERALGDRLALEISSQSKPVNNAVVDAYVKRVGGALSAQVRESLFEYRFELISDRERTEPVPLPGGRILIPLKAFVAANDEGEFAGVLAHAISHVALRHGTRYATRGQLINLANIPLVFMGGESGAHVDPSVRGALPLGMVAYVRTFELDADRSGVELAARAGYDPSGLSRYIDRTQPSDTKPSPLPERDTRLARLHELEAALHSTRTQGSGDEYRRVQEMVRELIGVPEQRRVPTLFR